jgi:CubicO group peptidase (beta-lactamase class C family)
MTDHAVASHGRVAPGYEPVLEAFASGAGALGEGGGALSAYFEGEPVVDLWAGTARPGVPWAEDSMTTIYSVTKGMAALCMQILADRGALDVDAPVARYWPEFAQAGKERALVRHVLDHTIGVVGLPDADTLLHWDGRGWDDYDAIAERLASARPAWEPGTRISYHGMTAGWLMGELVRRITGETIGAFFRAEVARPLGVDLWIGTPPDELGRVADLIELSLDGLSEEALWIHEQGRQESKRPETLVAQTVIYAHGRTPFDDTSFLGSASGRRPEIAATNGSGTARGIARMYAMLAMGGELDGTRIVSPQSVATFGAESATGPSAIWPTPGLRLPSGEPVPQTIVHRALGYASNPLGTDAPWSFGPAKEAFGHEGFGGQLGFCDPVGRIAVGFVRNHLTMDWSYSEQLVAAIYDCARTAR